MSVTLLRWPLFIVLLTYGFVRLLHENDIFDNIFTNAPVSYSFFTMSKTT